MKEYQTAQIRNIALLSHGSAGKTSLAEAMLFDTGAINRRGTVDEGTTASDYDEEEIRRQISLSTSVIPCEWDGHKINVLDTPGYLDFVGEVKGAVRVADAALILLDATSGVEVGTDLVWGYADEQKLPRLVFVNKMDRENASFQRCLDDLRDKFEAEFIPIQLPIGSQDDFEGIVDLIALKAYLGSKAEEKESPSSLQGEIDDFRLQLIEAAAESEDDLIVKYLEGEDLAEDEIRRGLKARVADGSVVPVLCGSAIANIGVQPLLQAIIEYLPSPAEVGEAIATNPVTGEEETLAPNVLSPLAVLAFKNLADPYVGKLTYFRVYSGLMESDSRVFNSRSGETERIGQLYFLRGKDQIPTDSVRSGDIGAVSKLGNTSTGDTLCDKGHPLVLTPPIFPKPVFSVAVHPKTKSDLDKMSPTLARLSEEDPTLQVDRESSTNQTILSGMGESHVDIAARRLLQKFGVSITTSVPKIPYRETITKTASAQGRHKKQTGGRGQFGDVHIRFEPLPAGSGFEFADEIRGGTVPSSYIPAVEKGLREIIENGVLAGYPTSDFRAALYYGSFHTVDSSEIAFKLAAHLAFKKGIPDAGPVLLEPIMNFTITIPEEFTGDVMGDLNSRRGRVQGMEQQRGMAIVTAQAPLAEMQRYATDLRSITQGRGIYSMEFSHYQEVPTHVAQGVIEEARRQEEE